MDLTIRDAVEPDLDAVKAIYDVEVAGGHATFDTEPPDLEVWRAKLAGPDPLLVAVNAQTVVGFAYADRFRPRAAYHLTRETSLYLTPAAQGRGLGTRLYAELLARLRAAGCHTAMAVVAQPNEASDRLHRRLGFAEVGMMREVGDKLGRMIDVRLYQLLL